MRVRPAAAAGLFYPADAQLLAADLDALLAAARAGDVLRPHGIVVPHAGYPYSGPVAAVAYAALRSGDGVVRRVVVAGPAHFVPLRGAAVPEADAWETPLGRVTVDTGLRDVAVAAGVVPADEPHVPEHAVEVQLPFLQRLAGEGLRVLPVAVGEWGTGESADLLGALWDIADLVVVSTDLSHDLPHEQAQAVDRRTAAAVTAREPEAIGRWDACGVFALRGLVELARRRDLSVRLLDLRTSADTAGDPERVVGYGAFAVG
jgi:hypothetical protein